MPIPANPVSLGDPTKKTHYDTLYNNAVLANTGGTPGGAQTIPGVKTFSGGLISMMDGNIASVSADYTILDDDNYKQVLVTTSSSTTTVTLPTLAANLNRTILIMKADSGTGEVYIEGEGAETINGFSTLYLNRKYQKVLLLGGVSEWIKLDGEPSYMQGHIAMGGGAYVLPTSVLLLSNQDVTAAVVEIACASYVPEGAVATLFATYHYNASSDGYLTFGPNSDKSNPTDVSLNYNSSYQSDHVRSILNSSRSCYFWATNANQTAYVRLVQYWMGF